MNPRLLIHLLCWSTALQAAEMRSWTDVQKRTIEARMLSLDGDQVILEMKDGRKVPFPIARLSPEDAAYVRGVEKESKAASAGGKPNFDMPWPERVKYAEDAEIAIVEEDAEKKRFVYESANYRYHCDVRLGKSVVKGFAILFEATHLFCRSIPLALDGGRGTEGKLQIHLFEKNENYVKAGGLEGSAGAYLPGKRLVLVPLGSLGVRPLGSGYMLDRDKSSQTLPHELTHQLTPASYFKRGSLGWFSEGIAEYIAVTPYRSGAFSVRNNHKDIIGYVTAHGSKEDGGRALGEKITMRGLEKFFFQSYDEFIADAQKNYGCALLITYYFLQMDGEGDGRRIKAFLKALRAGKEGAAAVAVLLDGRTYAQLEEEVSKAWNRRGIDLTFESGG